MTAADQQPVADLNELVDFMRTRAAAQGDNPEPLMQGTFALYATPEGGVMMVAAVPEGPMEGTHHYHMNPHIMQGVSLLFGGNKMRAVKGLFRRRKGIEDGR